MTGISQRDRKSFVEREECPTHSAIVGHPAQCVNVTLAPSVLGGGHSF